MIPPLRCCVFLLLCCVFGSARAQKKLLILGSSTPACYNIQYDSCYVGRLQRYFQQTGASVVIDNRAVAGDNCYHGMPTSYTPPPGRNAPRPFSNITEALQGNPDIVLVNYPSNGYDEFSLEEVLFCLRTIRQTALNAGKPCYIATSQPRSEPASFQTPAVRQKMQAIKESILNEFGPYAINFWDGLVNGADNSLLPEYNSGDGTHLTAAGHRVLFNKVVEKNIFSAPQTGGGLTYSYYEGSWTNLPDFSQLSPIKTGPASSLDLSIRNRETFYGIQWTGSITIPASGTYTFETISDDGSLVYLGQNLPLLVNNDGQHGTQSRSGSVYLAAGTYPIRIAYMNACCEGTLQFYWSSSSGITRQPVPASALEAASPVSTGLSYSYYEGNWTNLPDFNQLPALKTGTAATPVLAVRNRDNFYGLQWTGTINIPVSGTYTFETVSDDGSMLYIGQNLPLVVNNDGQHGTQSRTGSVYLAAGAYPFRLAYMNACCEGALQLFWSSSSGLGRQLVPASAFTGGAAPAGNLNFRYYEGSWDALPDFNLLSPVKTGSSANIDLSRRTAGVNDNFAFVWEGTIRIPAPGNYTFETVSDDGSKVYFNSGYSAGAQALVNNDGLHGAVSAAGTVYIPAAGTYPIAITYFERGGDEVMQLYWSGPGIGRQPIPSAAFDGAGVGAVAESLFAPASAAGAAEKQGGMMIMRGYPNPFSHSVTIDFFNGAKKSGDAELDFFDSNGRLITRYRPGKVTVGLNRWNIGTAGKHLAAGLYSVQLRIGGVYAGSYKLMKTTGD